jgi:SAM-dependent methyltransferase
MKDTTNASVPYFSNMLAWGDNETNLKQVYAKYANRMRFCGNVLDIGCGRGYFMDLLLECDIQATGIDYDLELVASCQARNLDVIQIDAIDYLQNAKTDFGGVFCGCMIEHLDAKQAETLIRECSRLIRPKGLFIIVTDNPAAWRSHADWFWRDLTHRRLYPLSLLRALFEHYGFKIVDANPDYELTTLPKSWSEKIIRTIRRIMLGKELFDAIYGPGAIFIIGEKQ